MQMSGKNKTGHGPFSLPLFIAVRFPDAAWSSSKIDIYPNRFPHSLSFTLIKQVAQKLNKS